MTQVNTRLKSVLQYCLPENVTALIVDSSGKPVFFVHVSQDGGLNELKYLIFLSAQGLIQGGG
jgi:hypothetical protein